MATKNDNHPSPTQPTPEAEDAKETKRSKLTLEMFQKSNKRNESLSRSKGKMSIFDESSSSSSSSSLMSLVDEEGLLNDDEVTYKENESNEKLIIDTEPTNTRPTTKPVPQDARLSRQAPLSPSDILNLKKEEEEEESLKRTLSNNMPDFFSSKKLSQKALYLHIHSNAPCAILYSLHSVCITDDVALLRQLLEDVGGIPYVLRHALFMERGEKQGGGGGGSSSRRRRGKEREVLVGKTIFWVACYYGSAQVLKLLLRECKRYFLGMSSGGEKDEEKADKALCCLLDIETEFGSKPILIATAKNHPNTIQTLLEHNVDPNTCNKLGITSTIIASYLNHVEVLKVLSVDKRTNFNHHSLDSNVGVGRMCAVHAACIGGHVDTLRFLSGLMYKEEEEEKEKQGEKKEKENNGEMLLDFKKSEEEGEDGGDVLVDFTTHNGEGYSCVGLAALHNRAEAIKFLSTITGSKSTKHPDLNQRFYRKTDPNHPLNGEAPIHTAVRNDSGEALVALLSNRHYCDPLARNMNGMTALHIAAEENKPRAAAQFVACLDREALELFDSEDVFGRTPLYIAASLGHCIVVDFLAPVSDVSRKVLSTASSSGGGGGGGDGSTSTTSQPALLAATANNHVEVISSLLAHGANVNQSDDAGHTAISIAAKKGYLHACEILLRHHADLKLRSNKGGGTPLQKARKYRHQKVVELLESHGGT